MLNKITRSEFYENLNSYIINNTEGSWYWIYDRTAVNYGLLKDCNIQWCKDHNIETNNACRIGGCIVSTSGNLNLVDIRKFDGHTWLATNVLKDFTNFLKSKDLDAVYDHNDVLVSGYKVASGVSFNIRPSYKYQYTGLQFSINQDYEVIKNACLKKSSKQPGALSDYGITTEDVEQWITEYFK